MAEVRDARWASWNRRLARVVVRPFAATRLHPNHITTLRIVLGLAACGLFAPGGRGSVIAGGALWAVSAFLDRCDGEFARMTGRTSRFGQLYDFLGDVAINALVFLAIGFGVAWQTGALWLLVLGICAGAGVALAAVLAEWNERGMALGERTFSGIGGFDFDDLIYLIALFAWADLLTPLLIAAAFGGPVAALVVATRLWRKCRKRL